MHDLVPNYQSAYHNGYSCKTAIVKLVNDILWAMENQNITAIMALDLSAAFDTVNHEILLNVLEKNFGLKGTVLNWFNSYLDWRSCKVNIGEEYSSTGKLPFSVPQGSCAGAQLFNLFCSTMQEVVNPPLTCMVLLMTMQWETNSNMVNGMRKKVSVRAGGMCCRPEGLDE